MELLVTNHRIFFEFVFTLLDLLSVTKNVQGHWSFADFKTSLAVSIEPFAQAVGLVAGALNPP